MVEGLELFASHFSPFIDNYVLIGGAACDLAMTVAGTGFRATRDLEHLIPLKVRAWLDLSQRKQQGQPVDSRDIKKHKNDIFRLMTVVDPGYQTVVPKTISDDMRSFVEKMPGEQLDLKSLGFRDAKISELLEQLTARYVT